METKKITLTRKIQLLINSQDAEIIKANREKLYRWQYIGYRAANMIMSHLFVQEQIKDFFYFTEDFKLKLTNQQKDEQGVLTTSRLNTTYTLLSKHFKGEIPTDILSNLNNTLNSYFSKEVSAYRKGEKSLRNYKRKFPLPFSANSIRKLQRTADSRNFSFELFQVPFRTYLGKDRDKRILLEKTRQEKIKLCTSSLYIDQGKIFLLAVFEMEKEENQLDEGIIAEASLSINHPVTITIGKEQFIIGNKEEFLHRRLAIQAARRRTQKGATFNKGGHGHKRKMKSTEHYNEKEHSYVNYKLHVYSRRLIDLCVKNKAATLILVNQKAKEEIALEDTFLLQNWSYFNLKDKIAYKAKKAGIVMVCE